MRRLLIVALLVALSAGDALARDYEHHVNLKGGATLQVAGTSVIEAGKLYLRNSTGQTAYKTSTAPIIYGSNAGGTGYFADSQNVIIQGFTDTTQARDIVIATGITPVTALVVSRTGEVNIGSPTSPNTGAGKLNVASNARIDGVLATTGRVRAVTTCTDSYTTVATDEAIFADKAGDLTVTLVAAADGRAQWIYKVQSAGTLTIAAGSGDTINGAASKTITAQYSGVAVTAKDTDSWYGTALTAL